MNKTYQLKMTLPKADPKTVESTPGANKATVMVKAEAGARYQLLDAKTGLAPDNIRVSRSGKSLRIHVEGQSDPAFVVADFYDQTEGHAPELTGKAEDGQMYRYIPETAIDASAIPVLKDNGQTVGMALGGNEIGTGAAVGLLAPVAAAFNPLLLGAGVLGAAAAAGGGGGGGGDSAGTASTVYAKLGSEDTGPQGDNITKDQTPSIVGKATPKSTVTVTLNGKGHTGTADDSGNFEIQIPDTDKLLQGRYVPKVVAKLNGVTTNTFDGTPFIIDLSSDKNIDNADGAEKTDTNSSIAPSIDSISIDSADPKDFYTHKDGNNGLKFVGTAKGMAIDSQDWIELNLTKPDGTVLKEYVRPDTNGNWSWDKLSTLLTDGKYTLSAQVVDGAGNAVGSPKSQVIVVDTSASQNTDPGNSTKPTDSDPNYTNKAAVDIRAISDDSGPSDKDFITNDHGLIIKGTVSNFTNTGYGAGDRVWVQVLLDNSTDNPRVSGYATLSNGTWSLDANASNLPNGAYTIKASIVDKAGNVISTANDQRLTIKDQAAIDDDANKNATLSISSITDDTGYLGNDFVTDDATLLIKGTVVTFTPNGDKVLVQILKDNQVVAQTYADPSSGKWEFDNTGETLLEGTYSIKASIVDNAGNTVNAGISQTLLVDSNMGLELSIQSMTTDSGSGPGATDWITNDTRPVFKGNFGSGKKWTANGDQFLAQIYDSTGKLVGSFGDSAISSDGTNWSTTENGLILGDGHYTLRTSISNDSGQIFHVAEKQFVIDESVSTNGEISEFFDEKNLHDTKIIITTGESLNYALRDKNNNELSSGKFEGIIKNFQFSELKKIYKNTEIDLIISDNNGNSKIVDLADDRYLDSSTQLIIKPVESGFNDANTDFSTISTYKLGVTEKLDLDSIIISTPTTGSQLVYNDLNMWDTSAQSVTISLNDVLHLGTTNAFDKTGAYSGDIQMRVSGNGEDTVRLSKSDDWKLLTGTKLTLLEDPSNSSSTPHIYHIYTNSTGKIDLFIEETANVVLI